MQEEIKEQTILVTGASGFLAGHIIYQLLENNYFVIGTIRSLKEQQKIDSIMQIYPTKTKTNLKLVEADLLDENCWLPIIQKHNIHYIIHTASPFPSKAPKTQNDLIKPAVEGAKHVMQSAIQSGIIKRVIFTSSVVAMYNKSKDRYYDEND